MLCTWCFVIGFRFIGGIQHTYLADYQGGDNISRLPSLVAGVFFSRSGFNTPSPRQLSSNFCGSLIVTDLAQERTDALITKLGRKLLGASTKVRSHRQWHTPSTACCQSSGSILHSIDQPSFIPISLFFKRALFYVERIAHDKHEFILGKGCG